MESIKTNIEFQLQTAQITIFSLCSDANINLVLNKDYSNKDEYLLDYQIYNVSKLNTFHNTYMIKLSQPHIYTNNPTLLYNNEFSYIDDSVQSENWYAAFVSHSGNLFYVEDQTASLLRRMDFPSHRGKYEKIIKIDLNLRFLMSTIRDIAIPCSILLYNDDMLSYRWDYNFYPKDAAQSYAFLSNDSVNEETCLVFSYNDGSSILNDWKMVFVTDTPLLYNPFTVTMLAISMTVSILAIMLFAYLMNRSYINKIIRISEKLNSDGIFPVSDDLDAVEGAINILSDKIRTVTRESYEIQLNLINTELEKKQAELNALLAQINPHYLFNVLNSIKSKCLLKHDRETAHVIMSIAKLLRRSIDFSDELTTVAEEMQFLKDYLDIERYRFGDKFFYKIECDPHLNNVKIPKMIFQPLAENACVHGAQNSLNAGYIQIRLYKNADRIVFEITNPVDSFNEEDSAVIIKNAYGAKDPTAQSIGLKNVVSRMKYYYGTDFNLSVMPAQSSYATVTFQLSFLSYGEWE